jgi:hypothetical protein
LEAATSLLKQQRKARVARDKLSPLGLKLPAKSIGISDYQAYAVHTNIVPYPEKLRKLEQTEKA